MIPSIKSVIITEDQIQHKIRLLADQILHDFSDGPLVILSVLKGSFIFHADLVRALAMDIEVGFISLSSYRGATNSQGEINHIELPLPDLKDKNVLLLEDIYDTGASMAYAYELCKKEQPKILKTCVLLIKKGAKRIVETPIDYYGFSIPNLFVVGYGLDYQERYRQLPFIAEPYLKEN